MNEVTIEQIEKARAVCMAMRDGDFEGQDVMQIKDSIEKRFPTDKTPEYYEGLYDAMHLLVTVANHADGLGIPEERKANLYGLTATAAARVAAERMLGMAGVGLYDEAVN